MGKSIEELLDIFRQVRIAMAAGDVCGETVSFDLTILPKGVSVVVPGGEGGSVRGEFPTLSAALMAMIESCRKRVVAQLNHLDSSRLEKSELLRKLDQLVNQ